MAKKQEEEAPSIMAKVSGFVAEIFKLKDVVQNVAEKAKEGLTKAVKKVERALVGGFFVLFGTVFVLISIAFLLKEFLKVSFGFSFLGIGIILIIFGMIYKNYKEM
jgi:hypothetical protein